MLGVLRACQCGWQAQTVRHILLHCPRYNRQTLITQYGSERLGEILRRLESARLAARWFIHFGVMEQFRIAKEINEEDRMGYRAFQDAEKW